MRGRNISTRLWATRVGWGASGNTRAKLSANPRRRSAIARSITPPFEVRRPPSKAAVTFLASTAGNENGRIVSSGMAGVAFAVEGDGVGFATESYAASALYTTLANLSGAFWRIRRASERTTPRATGSPTAANTTGMVRLSRIIAVSPSVPPASTTSGASAASSAAPLRSRSGSSAPQRTSIRRFWPSLQPNCCRRCWIAAMRACPSEESAARFISTPIRRCFADCCARPAIGKAAAAQPSIVTKSRRRICALTGGVAELNCTEVEVILSHLVDAAQQHPPCPRSRDDGFGSKGEILAPSICFPLYPQHRTSPRSSIRRRTYNTSDIPFAELKLALVQSPPKQLMPKPQPVGVDHVRLTVISDLLNSASVEVGLDLRPIDPFRFTREAHDPAQFIELNLRAEAE